MNAQERFFYDMRDYRVVSKFYENEQTFSVEDLYQAFKGRFYEETKAQIMQDVQDMLTLARNSG